MKTKLKLWLKSYKRSAAAQRGLLQSIYGFNQLETRETQLLLQWPKCTWTYGVVHASSSQVVVELKRRPS